jgi:hypothetical protein
MTSDQKVLDERFKEATATAKTIASQIRTGTSNNFVDNELSLILTTLSKGLGTHLEILEILNGDIKEITEPS